jgi:hypothetical protein
VLVDQFSEPKDQHFLPATRAPSQQAHRSEKFKGVHSSPLLFSESISELDSHEAHVGDSQVFSARGTQTIVPLFLFDVLSHERWKIDHREPLPSSSGVTSVQSFDFSTSCAPDFHLHAFHFSVHDCLALIRFRQRFVNSAVDFFLAFRRSFSIRETIPLHSNQIAQSAAHVA